MINFFIDDSGSVSLNDKEQPIFLFSSLCIPGDKLIDITEEMDNLRDNILKDIESKLIHMGESDDLDSKEANKFSKEISKKLKNDFEIHCSEISRGDNLYSAFNKDTRNKYIIDILKLIKKYNLDIITIYCDKDQYSPLKSTSKKDAENKKDIQISQKLITSLSDYLKRKSKKGTITIDKGNQIINTTLIPLIMKKGISLDANLLSPNIQQIESHKNSLIQLADVVAYVTNFKLSIEKKVQLGHQVKEDKLDKSNQFFNTIEDNNSIINVFEELADAI